MEIDKTHSEENSGSDNYNILWSPSPGTMEVPGKAAPPSAGGGKRQCGGFGKHGGSEGKFCIGRNNTWHSSQRSQDCLWHLGHFHFQQFSLHFRCLLAPGEPSGLEARGFLRGAMPPERVLLNTPTCSERFLTTSTSRAAL